MPKITLEEFFKQDVTKLVKCTSKEQSDAVRQAFHAMKKTWRSGNSYLELDYWNGKYECIHYTNDGGYDYYGDSSYMTYNFDDIIELSTNPTSEPKEEPEPDPNQLRILLRSDYQWHDACWDGQMKFFSIDTNRINTTEIISVENDPRTKYVQCTKCHSIIKNTKKAIESHVLLSLSSKTCLTCKYLRPSKETTLKESLVKNDDGTYTRTKKTVCSLTCGNNYRGPSIESSDARNGCMYARCRTNTVAAIDDFFIKYPGAFDEMATVDALDMSKWQVNSKYLDNIYFKWSGRYNFYVYTTSLGIIDRFECTYRNNHYKIAYSKKYDKMFVFMYGEYSEVTASSSIFSSSYYNELMKIMRNIYKGEN